MNPQLDARSATAAVSETPSRGSALVARWITEVFAPAVLATVMPVVVALNASSDVAAAAGWSALTVVFTSALPYGVIWYGVRKGRLTDHHIGVREQRRGPLVVALSSVVVGLLLLVTLGAPRPLIAMVVVMLAVLLAIAAVNHVWKVSAHTAVAAGSVAVLVLIFGSLAILFSAIVAAVAWSRVKLGDHTIAQVVAGAAAGVLVAVPVFVGLT